MIRDIFIFNEKYRERYFDMVADNENLYYDNLPLVEIALDGVVTIKSAADI